MGSRSESRSRSEGVGVGVGELIILYILYITLIVDIINNMWFKIINLSISQWGIICSTAIHTNLVGRDENPLLLRTYMSYLRFSSIPT